MGNARHFDYRTTSINLPEKAEEQVVQAGATLAVLLGVNPRLISRTPNVNQATVIIGKDNAVVLKRLEELARQK